MNDEVATRSRCLLSAEGVISEMIDSIFDARDRMEENSVERHLFTVEISDLDYLPS